MSNNVIMHICRNALLRATDIYKQLVLLLVVCVDVAVRYE